MNVKCPKCGKSASVKVTGAVNSVTCPHCKEKFNVNIENFSKIDKTVEKNFSKFEKAFKGKR